MKMPRPTDAELAILRVLWARGPSTVREVHGALGQETGYTTTLKLMQIMQGKGLVVRDESGGVRMHKYAAAAAAEKTKRQLVKDLLDRAFNGSPAQLLLHALSAKRATAEELAELRALLERHREKKP